MRCLPIAVLLLTVSLGPSDAGEALRCEIRWPNPDIPVPERVRAYIAWECAKRQDAAGESLAACENGERYGYRAVVEMLSHPETGEVAAERYRACAAGLGDFGGRFHRRRAECLGGAFRYLWRFEYSRHASARRGDAALELAASEE